MLVRVTVVVALLASALISTFELSACVLHPASSARRAPAASVAHFAMDPDVDDGVPTAPEIDGPAPATSPSLTY
jgi:hypothetical protein